MAGKLYSVKEVFSVAALWTDLGWRGYVLWTGVRRVGYDASEGHLGTGSKAAHGSYWSWSWMLSRGAD